MNTDYARLDDFGALIHHLMSDPDTEPLALTLGQETAVLSLLLRVYVLPDLDDKAAFLVQEMCDTFSNEIIRRYPFSEGYIDFLYGVAMFRRGMG